MKSFFKIITLIVAAVLVFCSCSNLTTIKEYYSFLDDSQNIVTLYSKPQRVAVLLSSYAEIWQNAGGKVDITVGETVERNICNNTVLLVDDGAGKTINTELLVSFKPDFIIGSADLAGHKAAFSELENTGAPFCLMRVESFNDYLRVLKIFCDITQTPKNYNEYGLNVKENIDALLLKTKEKPTKKVLFIRSGSSESSLKAKSSDEHFAATMLKELNAINIADSAPILLDGLSQEEVLSANPQYIFVSTMGNAKAAESLVETTFQKPEWQEISAVKNNNVIFLEKDLFQYKPNHRWYESYLFLAKTLYGEENF